MDPKSVCRLCSSKDDVKHNLFVPDEDGNCLSEDVCILTNIEITKEDHLSEHICANCYKVNSFFKEFRKNSVEVNDHFKTLKTSEKSPPASGFDIIIKEEILDDHEEQSADTLGSKDVDTLGNCDVPYPVALVQSLRETNDLSQLQSNFIFTKRSREEAGASVRPENQKNNYGVIPNGRAEKRRNEDADNTVARQRPRMVFPSEEDPSEFDFSSDSSSSSDDSDDEDDKEMLMLLAVLL